MIISARVCGLALAFSVGAAPAGGRISTAGDVPQRAKFDAALTVYLGGDPTVVGRTFPASGDYAARARDLDHWLEAWDPAKAVFVLEVARQAVRVAPRFTVGVVNSGRTFLRKAGTRAPGSANDAAFLQTWHRVASALLQDASDPARVEEYVTYVEKNRGPASGTPMDGRLLLARAVAQERRCWDERPVLEQAGLDIEGLAEAAGVVVPNDLDGLAKAGRAAKVRAHRTCLDEALTRYEVSAASEDARAEAQVRSGWILFQQGRYKDALERLDITTPAADSDVAFWHALFRGRVLHALGRIQDAAVSYRAAVTLVPTSQSAGVGLALALVRLDRDAEADEAARALRAAGASGADPWSYYISGDYRFVDTWIAQLRTTLR